MKISIYDMSVESFVPMLKSLAAILDQGAARATFMKLDLLNARLAPDMYTLAQQVQIACDHATDCVARLAGKEPRRSERNEATVGDLTTRISKTIENLANAKAADFEGAEDRDCSVPGPNGMVFAMNGVQYLRDWALPHFYFHVVTAYDILRNHGVALRKQDYLSGVGAYMRPHD